MVAHITVLIDDLFRLLSKLSQCYCLWFLVVRSLVSTFFVFLYDLPLSFSLCGVVKNYKQVVLGPRAVLAGFPRTAFFLVLLFAFLFTQYSIYDVDVLEKRPYL